jgi:hypothetical protein
MNKSSEKQSFLDRLPVTKKALFAGISISLPLWALIISLVLWLV